MLTERVIKPPRRDGGVSALPVLDHARQILRTIGWPLAGNHELIADCIQSIAKAKALDFSKASEYLARAIRLAREQGIVIDRFFFADGRYMEIRPAHQVSPGGDCRTCGDEGLLLQSPDIPGLRLIACPHCAKGREQAARLDKRNTAIQQEQFCNLFLELPESQREAS